MAKRALVIDRDDRGQFFLHVEGETLTIGTGPAHAEAILRDLHISRIHCEIEVEEDTIMVGDRQLHLGQSHQVGPSRLRLESAPNGAPQEELPALLDEAPVEEAEGAAAAAEPAVRKQL